MKKEKEPNEFQYKLKKREQKKFRRVQLSFRKVRQVSSGAMMSRLSTRIIIFLEEINS